MEGASEVEVKSDSKVVKKDKPCSFYGTPRGCVKGELCDFQHVNSPTTTSTNKPVNNRICNFYMTPQGCVKGVSCDFLHPRPTDAGLFPSFGPIDPRLALQASMGVGPGPQAGKKEKACDFFNTPRGCVKGDACDFTHVRAGGVAQNPYALSNFPGYPGFPTGALGAQFGLPAFGALPGIAAGRGRGLTKPKKCDFFQTPKGCVKGAQCDFIHTKSRPCEFFSTARGCRKGDLCDFQHVAKDGETTESVDTTGKTKTSHTGGNRFAPY